MIYYATIDTNVVVSYMLKPNSIPGDIINNVINGTIKPIISEEIIDEYEEVLKRNNFNFDNNKIDNVINLFKTKSYYFERIETYEEFVDKKDIVFYEIVMASRKVYNTYLVTGNTRHFPFKPYVVNPREMINIIQNNKWQIFYINI